MKRYLSVRWFLMMFILLFVGSITYELQAQQQQSERKVSFTLNTGFTYGAADNSLIGPFAGNFNVSSYQQSVYGGSFQYAFNPAWSVDTALQFGEFTNQFTDDPPFQNDYFFFTVKGVTNLNNLLNLNWEISRVMNPYLSLGLGMMRSRIQAVELDGEDLSLLATGGAGLSFYLFRSADLFVQYDYYVAGSDLLDGYSEEGGSDHFAAVNAGLRFNFGRSGTKLASWPPPREPSVREPAPRTEIQDEEERLAEELQREEARRAEEIRKEEERRAAELRREEEKRAEEVRREEERRAEELRREEERRAEEIREEEERRAEELRREEEKRAEEVRREEERRAEELQREEEDEAREIHMNEEQRLEELRRQRQRQVALLRGEAERSDERTPSPHQMFTDQPADGLYIQVSSFRSQASEEIVRNELSGILEDLTENRSQRVVIHRHENLHRVLVGPFAQISEARRVQQQLSNRYSDAFVIRYPR